MTGAAFVGYLGLVVWAFGIRTVLHIRCTGGHGWVRAPNRIAAVGDGAFTLGVAAALAGPLSTMVGVVDGSGLRGGLRFVGVVLVYGGGVLALLAQGQMGEAWRAGIDVDASSALVVGGLFRYSRNPFYLGMILATAGVALAVPSLIGMVGLALVVAGCYVDARWVEEPALLRRHGDVYASYRALTPRFVPRPWRLLSARRG